jgi:hypothetical protein
LCGCPEWQSEYFVFPPWVPAVAEKRKASVFHLEILKEIKTEKGKNLQILP